MRTLLLIPLLAALAACGGEGDDTPPGGAEPADSVAVGPDQEVIPQTDEPSPRY